MPSYWLKEDGGRLVGPLSLEAIREMAGNGRLTGSAWVSRDAGQWARASQLPELNDVLLPPAMVQRFAAERAEAKRILGELERIRPMATHEIFRVPEGADVRTYRQAFVAVGKQYHPGRLPANVHPDLLRACMQMFQHLSERMVLLERVGGAHPRPAPSPRSSEPEIGISLKEGRIAASVRVTLAHAGMFCDHREFNLSSNALFLASRQPVPSGTRLELLFRFIDPPPKDVHARGTVLVGRSGTHDRAGFGVRLDDISEGDREFLTEFVRRAREAAPPAP